MHTLQNYLTVHASVTPYIGIFLDYDTQASTSFYSNSELMIYPDYCSIPAPGDYPFPAKVSISTLLGGMPFICGGADTKFANYDSQDCYWMNDQSQWIYFGSHSHRRYQRSLTAYGIEK